MAPSASGRRYFCFSSSEPARISGVLPSLLAPGISEEEAQTRATSSTTMALATASAPTPPYSSGHVRGVEVGGHERVVGRGREGRGPVHLSGVRTRSCPRRRPGPPRGWRRGPRRPGTGRSRSCVSWCGPFPWAGRGEPVGSGRGEPAGSGRGRSGRSVVRVRNPVMMGTTSAALSRSSRWPPPSTTSRRASGIRQAMSRALTSGTIGSSSPWTTSVGCVRRCSHGRLLQPVVPASRYSQAFGARGRPQVPAAHQLRAARAAGRRRCCPASLLELGEVGVGRGSAEPQQDVRPAGHARWCRARWTPGPAGRPARGGTGPAPGPRPRPGSPPRTWARPTPTAARTPAANRGEALDAVGTSRQVGLADAGWVEGDRAEPVQERQDRVEHRRLAPHATDQQQGLALAAHPHPGRQARR